VSCVVSLSAKRTVVRTGRNFEKERGDTRTRCGGGVERVQTMTHLAPEVVPPVSNSIGKSCCSVKVVSEGVKKVKKESISVELVGRRGDSRNWGK